MLSWAATLPAIGDRIPLSLTILSTGMRSVVLRVRYGSNPHTPWQPESVILKRIAAEIRRLTQAVLDTFGKNTVQLPSMRWLPDIYPALYGVDDDLRCLALEDVVFEGAVPVANSLIADTSTQLFNQNNTARAFAAYAAVWGEFARQGIFDDTIDQYRASLAKADRRTQFPGAMPSPKLAEKGLQRLYPDLPAGRSEDAEEPTNDLQELIFRFHRITQPFSSNARQYPSSLNVAEGRSICSRREIFRRITCCTPRPIRHLLAVSAPAPLIRREPVFTIADSLLWRRCSGFPRRPSTRFTG